jgi:hypothetical protein
MANRWIPPTNPTNPVGGRRPAFQGSKKELKSFDGKGARPFQLFKSVSAKLLILFGHARSGEMENLPIALIALIAFIAFLLEPTISA